LGPGGYIYAIGELFRLRQPDLSNLFTRTDRRRTRNFLKKNALEHAIQLVGEEVHRQYILSFEPKAGEPGKFHAVRVAVKKGPSFRQKRATDTGPCSDVSLARHIIRKPRGSVSPR